MRKIFRGLVSIITAPFRWIWRGFMYLINKTFIGVFFAEDPDDTPILDTLQKVTDEPKDFLDQLIEHLVALRKHLLRAVFVFLLASGAAFFFYKDIMDLLVVPLPHGGLETLQGIEVTEVVSVIMQTIFTSAFAISIPYIFFELLLFIAPGISRKSRLIGLFGIPFIIIFFVVGVIFAYIVMMPAALSFLMSPDILDIQYEWTLSSYYSFATRVMFWIGLFFEMPLLSFILSAMRVLPPKFLKEHWRLAFILLALLAAMITPTPDPYNMMIVLLPLWFLYLLSIFMANLARREKKNKRG